MSLLKIAKIGHPILLKKTKEIKKIGSDSIKKIVFDMSETMLDTKGIGLAAPQVHINKRILIFRNPDIVEENIKKEEQMEFDVILESFGDRKIQVIKTVREITTLGLKESKVLVDGAPKAITEGVSEKVAEEIKIKLEKAGATVFIK